MPDHLCLSPSVLEVTVLSREVGQALRKYPSPPQPKHFPLGKEDLDLLNRVSSGGSPECDPNFLRFQADSRLLVVFLSPVGVKLSFTDSFLRRLAASTGVLSGSN